MRNLAVCKVHKLPTVTFLPNPHFLFPYRPFLQSEPCDLQRAMRSLSLARSGASPQSRPHLYSEGAVRPTSGESNGMYLALSLDSSATNLYPLEKETLMKHVQHAVSAQLPVPFTPLMARPIVAPREPSATPRPVLEILVYSPGPVSCRCGRYLSEDFDGRLFCRGCEGTDPSDVTPRLPLCHCAG
jgi:hypothetical protein